MRKFVARHRELEDASKRIDGAGEEVRRKMKEGGERAGEQKRGWQRVKRGNTARILFAIDREDSSGRREVRRIISDPRMRGKG